MPRRLASLCLGLSALAVLALGNIAPAKAAYDVTLDQVGPNVVATGSGTIDLTDLTFVGESSYGGFGIIPSDGFIGTGGTVGDIIDTYTGFTGPMSFGSGGQTGASSGSGDIAEMLGSDVPLGESVLYLAHGYTSGSPLTDTATYDGATFASLGVTPGTYEWTWGSGADADSFTLQVGPVAVPEPGSLTLLGAGLAGLGLVIVRRRSGRA